MARSKVSNLNDIRRVTQRLLEVLPLGEVTMGEYHVRLTRESISYRRDTRVTQIRYDARQPNARSFKGITTYEENSLEPRLLVTEKEVSLADVRTSHFPHLTVAWSLEGKLLRVKVEVGPNTSVTYMLGDIAFVYPAKVYGLPDISDFFREKPVTISGRSIPSKINPRVKMKEVICLSELNTYMSVFWQWSGGNQTTL